MVAAGAACGEGADGPTPEARVAGLPLHRSVVEHIAARDGLSPEQARVRAEETLRLVAAAREAAAAEGKAPGLRPQREQHLRRAARARLWLRERFEASHGPADIPDDHPILQRAWSDSRLVHPELFVLCQAIVEPPDVDDLDAKAEITADPSWREAASAVMAPLVERIERTVPVGDPDACSLITTQVTLSGQPSDERLTLTMSRPGGFDLDACLEPDDEGGCAKPQFAPEWTEVVRTMSPPRLGRPFFSRFGLHLVYVVEHLPAQTADDPDTDAALRQAVLEPWRAAALDRELQQMGQQRAVRMVRPTEDEP